jgi:hypothetical protein
MVTALSILGVVAAIVALTLVTNLPRELRLRKLAASRTGLDSFATFRASFPDMPEDFLRSLYRAIQGLVRRDFPVQADDNLWITLEVDQGSLEDTVEKLVNTTKSGKVKQPEQTITTVTDLARFVWQQRQVGAA